MGFMHTGHFSLRGWMALVGGLLLAPACAKSESMADRDDPCVVLEARMTACLSRHGGAREFHVGGTPVDEDDTPVSPPDAEKRRLRCVRALDSLPAECAK
jgi:hypothetical protein